MKMAFKNNKFLLSYTIIQLIIFFIYLYYNLTWKIRVIINYKPMINYLFFLKNTIILELPMAMYKTIHDNLKFT